MNYTFDSNPDFRFEPANIQPLRRKSLFELSQRFGCSILGTCLEIKEMRKISRKVGIFIPPGASEYDIHTKFVHTTSEEKKAATYIQKYLDKKFKKQVKSCMDMTSEDELSQFWDCSLENGDVSGAYWTILGHPYATWKIIEKVFGEVHMFGHQAGASHRMDIKQLAQLEKDNRLMEELLTETKTKYKLEISRKNHAIEELEQKLNDRAQLISKLSESEERIRLLEQGGERERLLAERNTLFEKYTRENERADAAEKLLWKTNQHLSAVQRAHDKLAEKYKDARDQLSRQEMIFKELLEPVPCDNDSCELKHECNCPGVLGKKLLYVGGRTNLVQFYRTLVEKRGGQFFHHDGGNEESHSRLDELLKQVDAVFCPVDCISHQACWKVKDTCKRRGKPFLLLRSSGLGALAGGITHLFPTFGDNAIESQVNRM